VAPPYLNYFVVWNIGQGQWVTYISSDKCQHFDVGGEFKTFTKIRPHFIKFCSQKLNELFLTHWDYDHILNLPQLVRHSSKVCWQVKPLIGAQKKMSQKMFNLNIASCKTLHPLDEIWHPHNFKNTNDASIVFSYKNFLISGDSPKAQEFLWTKQMNLQHIQVFLLVHHGSKTSTSAKLLTALPNLKMAVVSARYQKYKHPHHTNVTLLKQKRIPLLKTEDWGNLWFSTN
jgi:competence protein ComEC